MNSLSLTQNPSTNVIRMSGRTLVIARSMWLVVCVTASITFLFALPYRWTQFTHPSATNIANLTALGIAPTFFAGTRYSGKSSSPCPTPSSASSSSGGAETNALPCSPHSFSSSSALGAAPSHRQQPLCLVCTRRWTCFCMPSLLLPGLNSAFFSTCFPTDNSCLAGLDGWFQSGPLCASFGISRRHHRLPRSTGRHGCLCRYCFHLGFVGSRVRRTGIDASPIPWSASRPNGSYSPSLSFFWRT